jgi:hypothetical protein
MIGSFAAKGMRLEIGISAESNLVIVGLPIGQRDRLRLWLIPASDQAQLQRRSLPSS